MRLVPAASPPGLAGLRPRQRVPHPGQLRVLRELLESFDLAALVPRTSLVVGGAANGSAVTQEGTARAWALADEGRAYAVHLTRLRIAKALLLDVALRRLPAGDATPGRSRP